MYLFPLFHYSTIPLTCLTTGGFQTPHLRISLIIHKKHNPYLFFLQDKLISNFTLFENKDVKKDKIKYL